ncbi:hypothetical protein AMAG_15133 [Allomyces macrogynus ATCC 38327]|uniref:GAIN-B domain-containing protein n=1 Tax=Allomyces macrogynus (strain ATCC 38327) TaxID=578462 RepID=A0A0L0T5Y1_ALLM3|nr:hypothetical protein AMAG_15133 [Allomyces macrogynus ATCC 38327]|eukprot:KNE70160.1 hypothetical protein AMAG_15133 [Allomyces macrogynus ATCC 38327]
MNEEKRALIGDALPASVEERRPPKTWRDTVKLDRLVILFAVPLFVVLIIFVFRGPSTRLAAHLADEDSVVPSAPFNLLECSGHGLVTATGACFCDAGFAGTDCSTRVALGQPTAEINDDPTRRRSVALFVDSTITSATAGVERDSNVYLAQALVRAGLDVTVFTTARLDLDGATIERVPGAGIPAASVAVLQDLATRATPFDVVYFDANANAAFHTVAAQALGTRCLGSHLVVGVTHAAQSKAGERAADVMRDRTIELADHVVFATKALRDLAKGESDAVVAPLLTSGAHKARTHPLSSRTSGDATRIRNFVYLGPITADDPGLAAFLDALDRVHSTASDLHVTLLGPVGRDAAGIDLVRARAAKWPAFAVEVHDASLTPVAVLAVVTDAAHVRAAVVPAALAHAQIAQEVEMTGAPLVRGRVGLPGIDVVDDLVDQLTRVIEHGVAVKSVDEIETAQNKWVDTIVDLARTKPTCASATAVVPIAVVIAHPRGASMNGLKRAVAALEDQRYPALEIIVAADAVSDEEAGALRTMAAKDEWVHRAWKLVLADRDDAPLSTDALLRRGIAKVASEFVVPMPPRVVAKPGMLAVLARAAAASHADVLVAGVDSTVTRRRTLPLGGTSSSKDAARSTWDGVVMARTHAIADFSSDIRGLLSKAHAASARIDPVPEAVAVAETEHVFIATGALHREHDGATHLARRQAQPVVAPSGGSVDITAIITPPMPSVSPTVSVIATAPALLAACDDSPITIDLSQSTSSSGGELRYYYQYQGNSSAAVAAFSAANGTQSFVTVPATAVTVARPLSVRVRVAVVANRTVYSSSQQTVTVTRSPLSAVPQLVLAAAGFQGRLGDSLSQFLSVGFPACSGIDASSVSFNYSWTLTDPHYDSVNITSVGGTVVGPNIALPFAQLGYGTYTVTGSVGYNGTAYSVSAPFTVIPSPLVASITAGTSVQVAAGRANRLTVAVVDQDNLRGNDTRYTYLWVACDTGGGGCQSVGRNKNLVYPARSLTPGAAYNVFCQVIDEGTNPPRTAVAKARVTVVDAMVPAVVVSQWPASGAVTASQGVSLWAQVSDPDSGRDLEPKSVAWAIAPNSTASVDLSRVKRSHRYLVIGRDVLPAGQDVTFRVTVVLPSGVTTWADLTVPVAAAPAGGSVSVVNANPANMVSGNPASGIAFNDTFRIATGNWTGGTSPLSYTFGYAVQAPRSGNLIPNDLVLTMSPVVEAVTLPTAAKSVYVVVTDAAGATALATQQVTLVRGSGAAASNNSAVLEMAVALLALARAAARTNPTAALTTLNAITAMVADLPGSVSHDDRDKIKSLTASVLTTSTAAIGNLLPSPETAVRALGVLAALDLKGANATSFAACLDLVESSLAGCRVKVGGLLRSLDVRQAQSIARALDNVLQNLANSTTASGAPALRRRQVPRAAAPAADAAQRVIAQVQALVLATIAGESCAVSSVPTVISTASFIASGRRIAATGTDSGDSTRPVGNFSMTLPATMPAGCLDVHAVNWPSLHGSADAALHMVATILSVNAIANGTTTPLSTHTLNFTFSTTVNTTAVPAGSAPACVFWDGAQWTSSGCTTTVDPTAPSQVTCTCPMYSDFSVQAQVKAETVPDPGQPGAIAAGAVVGAVVLGGGGFILWKRRKAARGYHEAVSSPTL